MELDLLSGGFLFIIACLFLSYSQRNKIGQYHLPGLLVFVYYNIFNHSLALFFFQKVFFISVEAGSVQEGHRSE